MRRPVLKSHNASNTELEIYASQILSKMKKNIDLFIDPFPSLDDFERVIKEFRKAMADAAFRDRRAVALRNDKRKELLKMLRLLCSYVMRIADGEEATVLSSGFMLSKDPSSTKDNPKPTNLRVKPSIGTQRIDLAVDPWRPARMYEPPISPASARIVLQREAVRGDAPSSVQF